MAPNVRQPPKGSNMTVDLRSGLRNYTRWVEGDGDELHADILGGPTAISVDPTARTVRLNGEALSPDEARLIGVRLIDAAVLADGPAAIRARP